MRKVFAGLFISLDGVVEAPDQWQHDFDEEMAAEMEAQLNAQDAVLLGRVTYLDWASYWPASTDEPFASIFNGIRKYVVSSTLNKVEWNNSVLLKGDLPAAIDELKRQPGQDIGVGGSVSLIRSLLRQNLLDELRLLVHPVVVGEGRRLFDGLPAMRLDLAEAKNTSSGAVILVYRKRADPSPGTATGTATGTAS
ncbi:dihydrofolate reductase [Nonomuraea mesophila]|uniref:Dihydrofolate reductase n=1 Tax=Nonomuraea mesophila TaxID=2530382 RepID=A0A4R5FSL7_9ACTN|nr:dihydrofolate reductase family protein [Nonomuraea mesophila]TDE56295.1 dihydrofolate reductase [Nonomuraea mesophila]